MKPVVEFVKTTLVGGFLFLIPVVVVMHLCETPSRYRVERTSTAHHVLSLPFYLGGTVLPPLTKPLAHVSWINP